MADPTNDCRSLGDQADRLLLDKAGDDAAPERIAAVTVEVIEQICRRLAPLVGDSGISAVLDRSRKETRGELPFAGAPGASRRWPEQLEQLGDQLRRGDPAAARRAAAQVLASFVGMVCTFIGEPLTARLLRDLWPETLSRSKERT